MVHPLFQEVFHKHRMRRRFSPAWRGRLTPFTEQINRVVQRGRATAKNLGCARTVVEVVPKNLGCARTVVEVVPKNLGCARTVVEVVSENLGCARTVVEVVSENLGCPP